MWLEYDFSAGWCRNQPAVDPQRSEEEGEPLPTQ
jgi:hypothetical protein